MKSRFLNYLPLGVLTLVAIWPLLVYGPPSSVDGPNHFYRFVELEWHVRRGILYPRWFANLHHGFGAPVLNYYAPLSYYILLGLRLFLLPQPTAFLVGHILAVVVAVHGMYFWLRSQFASPVAALTAAAAYIFSPYLYYNLLERVGYAEIWALAFIPWIFFALFHFMRRPSRGARFSFIVLYAALILTHSISAVLLTPILFVYALALRFQFKSLRHNLKSALTIAAVFVHSAALAAFFMLPFVMESQFVQLDHATQYTIDKSFRTLDVLLAAPVAFDPFHVVDLDLRWPSLGWPQIGLALLALGAALYNLKRQSATRRRGVPPATPRAMAAGVRADDSTSKRLFLIAIMTSALVVFFVFLAHPTSATLWRLVRGADLLQFLWRMLGPATLLLAWLAGAGIAFVQSRRWRHPVALLSLSAFFFFSLPWTFHVPYDPLPNRPSPADIIQAEIDNPHWFGTTSTQEFLPRWVEELPPSDTLLRQYMGDQLPSRLDNSDALIDVLDEQVAPNFTVVDYEASVSTNATFNLYYFPGWTAELDGAKAPIQPSKPQGLIQVDLPAGRHSVRLALRPTAVQLAGNVISLLALGLLFAPFRKLRRQANSRQPDFHTVPGHAQSAQSGTSTQLPAEGFFNFRLPGHFSLLFAALLVLRIAVFDPFETPFKRSEIDNPPNPVTVNFDDKLLLFGVGLPRDDSVRADEAIDVRLYWRAAQRLDTDYLTTVQLFDQYGNRFGQSDNNPPSTVPTGLWLPDQYARDEHQILPVLGTPPGQYRLVAGVYSYSPQDNTTSPLSIRRPDGALAGIEYELATIQIERGRPQSAGALALLESSINAATLSVGELLPISLLWDSGDAPPAGLTAVLSLSAQDGKTMYAVELPPARPDYPSDFWSPNELIRAYQNVLLPPELPAGLTDVSIQLIDGDGNPATESYYLGELEIRVPERSFAIPPMDVVTMYDFEDAIRLLGYDRADDAITLYWQSLAPVADGLTVFVHRLDASGARIDGHDSPPERRTTSWLPGEVIADEHPLAVGDRFSVGLYDPRTGERFGAPLVVSP